MNKALKNKWIKALRSGKYKQATETLHYSKKAPVDHEAGGYCCLGVLCAVVGLRPKFDLAGEATYKLPKTQAKVCGSFIIVDPISDHEEYHGYDEFGICISTHNHLVQMNDYKISFNEIANYIEKNL